MKRGAITVPAKAIQESPRVKNIAEQTGKDTRLANEQFDLYMQASHSHGKYVARAKRYDDFYLGGERQWEEGDRQKLDAQGRPALTINQCMPIVNVVLGEQSSRRADVRFKPKKDVTTETAAVMGKVYQQVMDDNMYDWTESQVFADGVIQERGFFDCRIEFDTNLFGHVVIKAEDPCDIIIDRDAKEYDPDTWNEVYKVRWASLDYIEKTYGADKRAMLEHLASEGTTRGPESMHYHDTKTSTFGGEDSGDDFSWATPGVRLTEKRKVRVVRLIERQHKQLDWRFFFVDPDTGDKSVVPLSWDEQRMYEFAQQQKLFVHRVREQRVRWTVSCDSVLLHDDWSPYTTFTIVPFFPYFRRGKTAGVMTNLISPQEMLNKISSQVTHVVNTTANSGWIVEANSLQNMTVQELGQRGAETGLVIEHKLGTQAPAKIQPNQIPTGLERISMNAQSNMKEISGVTNALLGLESAEVSGVALDSKERRGQVQMAVPQDNLAKTRHYLTRKVVSLVQEFMTESRMLLITNHNAQPHEEEMEKVPINQPTPEGEVLNDITRGKYSWVISSQPARDTFNDSQFAEIMALKNAGILIPDDRAIEYSNLERKMELAEEVRAISGRGEMTPQEQMMAEMQQQFQMMMMQLELNEKEALIMKLQGEAQLAMAKAGAVPEELELKLQKAEQDLAIAREGFTVRKELLAHQTTGSLEGKLLDHKSKQVQQVTQARLTNNQPQN